MTRRLVRGALLAGCAAIAAAPQPAASQQPPAARGGNDPCFRAQPYPACRVFFLTDAGIYVRLSGRNMNYNDGPLRGVVDWGAMVNLNERDAVGGSWFVWLDDDGFTTGPALHWRRWFSGARSLDAAVGIPAASGRPFRAGTVLGMVKYNPVHWFGVSARPELTRFDEYVCGQTSCTPVLRTRARLYLGAESGWFPGLSLSIGAGLALGTIILLFIAGGGLD